MNRDEGTPVDEGNMVGAELTLCPRRERNALNVRCKISESRKRNGKRNRLE